MKSYELRRFYKTWSDYQNGGYHRVVLVFDLHNEDYVLIGLRQIELDPNDIIDSDGRWSDERSPLTEGEFEGYGADGRYGHHSWDGDDDVLQELIDKVEAEPPGFIFDNGLEILQPDDPNDPKL